MALLNCRECGQEIDSNTRQTRCRGCGALFPFACVVCERSLRPPFPVYSDERYLSDEDAPLCQQHFQRQKSGKVLLTQSGSQIEMPGARNPVMAKLIAIL